MKINNKDEVLKILNNDGYNLKNVEKEMLKHAYEIARLGKELDSRAQLAYGEGDKEKSRYYSDFGSKLRAQVERIINI